MRAHPDVEGRRAHEACRVRFRRAGGWRALGVLAAVATTVAALAPAAQTRPVIPHFTIVFYTAKISIKGGAHQDQANAPTANTASGLVVSEHAQGSYTVDTVFPEVTFVVSGTVPGGSPKLASARRVVVNGAWTNQGGTWDAVAKTTRPYTCSGTIGASGSGSPLLRWRKRASTLAFTAEVLHNLLTVNGQRSCPGNSFYLSQVDIPAYSTTFSIPMRELGRRTIVKSISGPLAVNRPPSHDCGYDATASCTFNTAWQGVIRFTRVRTVKT